MSLSLHISPCPNDTFAFDAIINRRIDHDFDLDVEYHDIEELNEGVLRGEPDISKISYAVYPLVADNYCLLDSGSALGRGNGPLLVRRKGESAPLKRIAVPGEHTTANRLVGRLFPEVEVRVPMLFSEIAEAVERGDVDAGVLIHEGRFVYERRNLELVADLGKLWEAETNLPLPLGAIIVKREIDENTISKFDIIFSAISRLTIIAPSGRGRFVSASHNFPRSATSSKFRRS
jgi:1,4-dihydroxy-6-naphthoate synthase